MTGAAVILASKAMNRGSKRPGISDESVTLTTK